VLAAFIAAGCIGQDDVRDEPSATATASALATPTLEPSLTAVPTATAARTEAPTAAPTPTPTEPEPSAEASPSGDAGSSDVCTGNDSNREFYANVAAAFAWPVYCPVLPARWSVISGRYRSAGGGWMEIAYKGPGGAQFELHEGAFCDAADGCVPPGSDAGTTAFGDLSGTLVAADDGRYAVVVDRGAARSWLAIGSGLDVEQFKAFAADLALVE
jgi:hypothetical protein